jgi:hypothetical protein
MPTLEFKGKQHIYAHHLTVPYRPLEIDTAKSLHMNYSPLLAFRRNLLQTITSSSTATIYMPSKLYCHAMPTVSSASTLILPTTPATRDGSTMTM